MSAAASLAHSPERVWQREPSGLGALVGYCRRNPQLLAGGMIVGALLLVGPVGSHLVDVRHAQPLSELPGQPPSLAAPFGTDDQGRDLLAVMVAGLPLTLAVGFLAGAIGLCIGTFLGLTSGFVGGVADAIIRMAVDTLLTVPALLGLIIFAASI